MRAVSCGANVTVRRKAMMGSRTEPVVLESGAIALQSGRGGQGPASPDELRAVGFTGDLALLAALAHHEIQEPGRFFPFGARRGGCKERLDVGARIRFAQTDC